MKNITKIVEQIIKRLKKDNKTISFAESCTGGRIASEFTAISGSSSVFNGSCVTYSNEVKHLWLGVDNEILQRHGAVSPECVSQMLKGVLKLANADYAIAVSGVAGPTGGSELKPVGTVYIGLLTPIEEKIYHCNFDGSRESIQDQSTHFAIEALSKIL